MSGALVDGVVWGAVFWGAAADTLWPTHRSKRDQRPVSHFWYMHKCPCQGAGREVADWQSTSEKTILFETFFLRSDL